MYVSNIRCPQQLNQHVTKAMHIPFFAYMVSSIREIHRYVTHIPPSNMQQRNHTNKFKQNILLNILTSPAGLQ